MEALDRYSFDQGAFCMDMVTENRILDCVTNICRGLGRFSFMTSQQSLQRRSMPRILYTIVVVFLRQDPVKLPQHTERKGGIPCPTTAKDITRTYVFDDLLLFTSCDYVNHSRIGASYDKVSTYDI